MAVPRLTRVNELLKREIAGALFRVMTGDDFDLAAVTVTHVFTSSDLHTARVLVSIRGHAADRTRLLHQLQRHRGEIQHLISKVVILKYTPQLNFALDPSLEEGDHVLRLIENMETQHPEWAPPTPGPEPNKDEA
ncbi:MAG: 30S ribosome-binding factor RbfA [Kiritimatiellaeota bacterium]|nr:30S ribosome-binding factor RbfA [Kiritimatiellota bacterium]